jgi:ArsR family transcriptional regulator, arsenate/arsenite/antimonite-responsive transcriptional repressor
VATIRVPLKERKEPARRGEPPAAEDVELSRLAKGIAHPARAAIVRMLLDCGTCICGDIVGRLPLAQATVSQHLKALKEAGWISGEVDGPRICYCVNPKAVERMKALVGRL